MDYMDVIRLAEVRLRAREARAIRLAAGLTVGDMARALGVTPGAVSRWERGLARPRGDAALRWHAVLSALRSLVGEVGAEVTP